MRIVVAFLIGLSLGAVSLYVYLLKEDRVLPAVARAASAAEPEGKVVAPHELRFGLPIAGLKRSDVRDMFDEGRPGHKHEAIDIMEPRGTPVLAVVDGPVAKLFLSKQGGITVYQFEPSSDYCYYYAHLDRYAEGIKEGMMLKRGQVLGYVGATGNAQAEAPHLHFAIFKLGPERQWWKGTAVNPYPMIMAALKG